MRLVAVLILAMAALAFPGSASAANMCFDETQFPTTFANEDINQTFFVGVQGQAQFECTSNWRVTMVPLYQDASGWHTGFQNTLIMPSPNGHFNANTPVSFFPPNTPPTFTGYWTNGDGLNTTRPVCSHTWRVRERFTNTGNGNLIGTYYSPTIQPSC